MTIPPNHLSRIHIIFQKRPQTIRRSIIFLLINNKKTSQDIQISADPSTSTASHDSQLRVDSSHHVIVDAIDSMRLGFWVDMMLMMTR